MFSGTINRSVPVAKPSPETINIILQSALPDLCRKWYYAGNDPEAPAVLAAERALGIAQGNVGGAKSKPDDDEYGPNSIRPYANGIVITGPQIDDECDSITVGIQEAPDAKGEWREHLCIVTSDDSGLDREDANPINLLTNLAMLLGYKLVKR